MCAYFVFFFHIAYLSYYCEFGRGRVDLMGLKPNPLDPIVMKYVNKWQNLYAVPKCLKKHWVL